MSSDTGAGPGAQSLPGAGVASDQTDGAGAVGVGLSPTGSPPSEVAGNGRVLRSRSTRSPRRRWRLSEILLAYLMLLPALAVFGIFIFYPFLKNFQLALYQNPPFPGLPSRYVGLHQVSQVLTSTSFLQSLETTLLFAVMTVPLGLFLGLVLATAAHKKLRGMAIYRTIFSSTIASSAAVSAVIFGTLMNPAVGLLTWLGISTNPPILTNPTWALPAIAVLTIWQGLGLSFILMSAGLQNVPDELLEAAEMDGAGPTRRFWKITVPLLSPFLFFGLVISTILVFQSVGQFDILTGQQSALVHTNVLIYNIYQTLFYQRNPGEAAVLSIALFVLTMGFTLAQIRLLERRVHYGG